MKDVQAEHREWLGRKYPGQQPIFPAVGMVEEAGELLHAILKAAQSAAWGEDPRYPHEVLRAGWIDGIGDCAIFAISFCNTVGWDFEALLLQAIALAPDDAPAMERAASVVGSAADFVVSQSKLGMVRFLAELCGMARQLNVDVRKATRDTWNEVRLR